MSRYDRHDIMLELIELSRDLKSEILLQLNYYRASVYKHEAAAAVESKIAEYQLLAVLIGEDELLDAFLDYESMKRDGPLLVVPGECLLSLRTMNLLQATDRILVDMISRHPQAQAHDNVEFSRHIQQYQPQLLALCRQGSRQWVFFNRLSSL
jgi:hypothetical protein